MAGPPIADCPRCGDPVAFDALAKGKKLCPSCGTVVAHPDATASDSESGRPSLWQRLYQVEDPIDSVRLTEFVTTCDCGHKMLVPAADCGTTKPCPKCNASLVLGGRCFYCRKSTPSVLHVFKCMAHHEPYSVPTGSGQRVVSFALVKSGFERKDVFVCTDCIRSRSRGMGTWLHVVNGVLLALVALVFVGGLAVSVVTTKETIPLPNLLAYVLFALLLALAAAVSLLKSLPTMLHGCRTANAVQQPIVDAYVNKLYPNGPPAPERQGSKAFTYCATHEEMTNSRSKHTRDYAV